jgi:cytidine deaminase
MEVCGKDLEVILSNGDNEIRILKLDELLPLSFNKDYLDI